MSNERIKELATKLVDRQFVIISDVLQCSFTASDAQDTIRELRTLCGVAERIDMAQPKIKGAATATEKIE